MTVFAGKGLKMTDFKNSEKENDIDQAAQQQGNDKMVGAGRQGA